MNSPIQQLGIPVGTLIYNRYVVSYAPSCPTHQEQRNTLTIIAGFTLGEDWSLCRSHHFED